MKLHGWQQAFLKMVQQREVEPFKWGLNDCVLFAADAVVLMGNPDPAADARGKYDSEIGAKKYLLDTYGGLENAWDAHLPRLDNPNFVQPGDVIIFESELGLTSGIYWNTGGVFAPSLTGVIHIENIDPQMVAAWRV